MPRSLRGALAEAAERVAHDMNAQGVANTLNAYSKLEEAAAEMPRSLRDALAQAAERVGPDMNAQGVANTLNACSKLEEAAAEMPRSLRDGLAEAAERVAPDMTAQHVANTVNAYSKLEEAAAEMPRSLRGALAEAAERVAGSAGILNKQLNNRTTGASSLEAVLELLDQHHEAFNYINVATAVTRIAKLAREQRRSGSSNAVTRDAPLAADERYVNLMRLVVHHLQSFKAREVANVISGLATLHIECGVTAEIDLLVQVGAAMERVAHGMTAQNVANTLSAYSKLEAAAAEMPRSLRGVLAQAAERVAPDMNAQEVGNTLNAYSKLREAAAEMPRSLRGALAEAAERVAPDMNAQSVANTLNAYSKLDETGLLLTSTRCPVETHLTATTSL